MESGQTIAGKYRLNQLLGAGGMASVWSATNVFTERQVAIKFMLPAVARTQEAARRFLMEAKVSARIDHPNVIEVMDVGQTEDGTLFLVMELLTGVSLETAMKRQQPTMTLHEFAYVMIQVARALAAAHKRGIIHRDLKPTNIFLHKSRDGAAVPKLLDFGVSKFLEEEGTGALTVAGTVLGSPLYMSPEQARGEGDIDGRTDVFAFGGIMFEALCGQRAFDGANFNQLIVAIATKPPKDVDELAPQMPEALRAVVRECLQSERDKRPTSLDAVAERLLATVPDLEKSPLRLPAPAGSTNDPDATNALPVVRPSDRPPPMPPIDAGGQTHTPWSTTPSGVSTKTVNSRPKNAEKILAAVIAAAAVLGLAVIATVGVFVVRRISASRAPVGRDGTTTASASLPAPPPPASAAGEPQVGFPVVKVDELPVAKPSAGAAASAPRPVGHLSIAAAPGWCNVSVDGKNVGVTPIASIDVPPGSHAIKCDGPGGKSRAASVTVTEAQTTRYKFATDD